MAYTLVFVERISPGSRGSFYSGVAASPEASNAIKVSESGAKNVLAFFGCGSESGGAKRNKGQRVRRIIRARVLRAWHWPKYSPDLNPQENVWSWVEDALRQAEERSDTFEMFCRKMLLVARRYPGGGALIPSMAERVEKVLSLKGGMSGY